MSTAVSKARLQQNSVAVSDDEVEDELDRRWQWKGTGEVSDGNLCYRSIVQGSKVITVGDTVYINSCTPNKPFIAEITSFYENLTDGQACANILWYFRSDELKKWYSKLPKKSRPKLPVLWPNEVFFSNQTGNVEISTISDVAYIEEVGVSVRLDSIINMNCPLARFSVDVKKMVISPLINKSVDKDSLNQKKTSSPKLYPQEHISRPGSHSKQSFNFESSPHTRSHIASRKSKSDKGLSPKSSLSLSTNSFTTSDVINYLSILPTNTHSLPQFSPSYNLQSSIHTRSCTNSYSNTPSRYSKDVLLDGDRPSLSANRYGKIDSTKRVNKRSLQMDILVPTPQKKRKKEPTLNIPDKKDVVDKKRINKFEAARKSSKSKSAKFCEDATTFYNEEPILDPSTDDCSGKNTALSLISISRVDVKSSEEPEEACEEDKLAIDSSCVTTPTNPPKRIITRSTSRKMPVSRISSFAGMDAEDESDVDSYYGNENEDDAESADEDPVWNECNSKSSVTFRSKMKTSSERYGRTRRKTSSQRSSYGGCVLVPTPRKMSRKELTLSIPEKKVVAGKRRKMDKFEAARERLHACHVPESLPCRENEFISIYSFVAGKIQDGCGGCMYVSGVPGTGKTATIHEVAENLKAEAAEGNLPHFNFVEVNGMRLTNPCHVYSSIWKQLTNEKVTPDHASLLLKSYFSVKNRDPTLLLADELDLLWSRKQTVLYNLFEWPHLQDSSLIVLAVANTMDLPERVMKGKISSRQGLTHLVFESYSHKQLQEIISSRLSGLEVFQPDAIELAVRKVAAVSGDVRRALDICRRATEIAELERVGIGKKRKRVGLVNMQHLQQSIQELCSNSKIKAIKGASLYEKLLLKGVLTDFKRTGLEETTFNKVCDQFKVICGTEGVKPVCTPLLSELCAGLGECGLLLVESGRKGLYRKIRLNVSQDDVIFALRDL